VVGDAAYVGERLRNVDGRISWTSRLKVTSVLHELPPPPWRVLIVHHATTHRLAVREIDGLPSREWRRKGL
jgi:hypothetical protein